MRKILLLGASGSIGSQSLDILKGDPKSFLLTSFSVGKRVEIIPDILLSFPSVSHICVQKESDYDVLKAQYPSIHFYFGDEGLRQICEEADYDMAVNALVGFAGLVPSITVLRQDKILALANKESLVVGGRIIKKLLKEGHGKLYPIDSEHVAIAKLLSRVKPEEVEKILITASGGSFRNLKREELAQVTPEMALAHPTWSMGAKITIDSSTMVNKGLEVMEAHWLFGVDYDRIKVVVQPQSIIHSMVEYEDGAVLAQMGTPDMKLPIQYALYYPKRRNLPGPRLDFTAMRSIELAAPDEKKFPALPLAYAAGRRGGSMPTVFNAANELAVAAFLKRKTGYLDIVRMISEAMEQHEKNGVLSEPDVESILRIQADTERFMEERFHLGVRA